MNKKSLIKNFDKIFILSLVTIFFIYNFKRVSYGLPFFLNTDEPEFQYSTLHLLDLLGFTNGYAYNGPNPLYAPLINLLLILKFVFINEMIINSLSIQEIQTKIYFNTELFIFYGRIASLTITSISIFFLYLIYKKLKINFLIYSILLITFSTSLIVLDISIVKGKNCYYLLFFLLQIYFFLKYSLKIEKFNFKAYTIFALLGSLAWGVNYWPALISIYSIFLLHFKKFKTTKLQYLFTFLIIFIFFGPIVNSFFATSPIEFLNPTENTKTFSLTIFIQQFLKDSITSFKFIFSQEKNFLLLICLIPFYLFNKNVKYKNEFIIIFFIIFEPIIIFGLSDKIFPQLRYFVGIFSLILILTAIVVNELNKFKYVIIILIISNLYFIYNNINQNIEINNTVSKNSFLELNQNINVNQKKILYLVDLHFQESLDQNLLYIKLFENDLIKESKFQEGFLRNVIENKIDILENTKETFILNNELKKNIIYFNYSFFKIKDLKLFFDYIKQNFEFVVIENSEIFYLSDHIIQNKIKNYVKENFELIYNPHENEKIYFRNFRQIISYFADTIDPFTYTKNIDNHELEKIYGNNYLLYKIK